MTGNTEQASSQLRGTVANKAPKPAGLLPKRTQQFVILGVAVVMVLIMWLTGGTKRQAKATTPAAEAAVQPPNPATVEDFRQSMQQPGARRQPISQANLERLRALGLAGDVPPGGTVVPPADTGAPQPGGIIGGGVGQESTNDPIKEDRKKRAYLSLFSPNVAFTYRNGHEAEQFVGQTPKPLGPGSQEESQLPQPSPTILPPAPGLAPQAKNSSASSNPDAARPGAFNSSNGNRYVAFEGTVLETLLINRLNGTFTGPVDCLVTNDLYSHDRQHVLIPAGTKVLGEAKKVEAFGQQRLAVFFHRLLMPDGYSVSLDQFKGLNQIGETALRDKVNNHYVQIFGASLAIGILGGVAEAGTGNVLTNSASDRMRQGFAASLATSSMNVLDRFLNILPTVTIREGSRVKVYLAEDLLLPDYAQHNMEPDL